MIALAVMLLAQAPPAEDLAGGEAMKVYYHCVAGAADDLVLANRGTSKRPGEAIADQAIRSCSRHRAGAFEAMLPSLMGDPRVGDYLRDRRMTAEEGRRLAGKEFDRALRRQLIRNVARLRGQAEPELSDAED